MISRIRITKTVKTQAFPVYLFLAALLIPSLATAVVTMRMQTDLGSFDIELFDTVAPLTVANFMNYVNDGDYDGTFIHRSVPGFVVQGGGFIFDESAGNFFSGGASHIPTDPAVVNEFNLSNLRGTIAMAKVGGDPDSATSEWFINLADNSANLDNQNGGFTVFAQVLGNGMDVVDAIAALPRCVDTTPFPSQCGQFQDVPFTGVAAGLLTNDQLVNISYIGTDSDGDGAIDNREDAAPNNGDGNNDGVPDKQQPNVASLVDVINGNYVTIAAGATFLLQNVGVSDGSNILLESGSAINLSGLNFIHGFLGYEVKNLDPGGEATVRIYLPDGESPVKYYKFGPTPDNPVDHLYEFAFDGETGAEINGSVITLHFVDGKRGDSDLTANGIIVDPGTPAIKARNTGASSGGGSGCSIDAQRSARERAGSWLLIAIFVFCLGIYRKLHR